MSIAWRVVIVRSTAPPQIFTHNSTRAYANLKTNPLSATTPEKVVLSTQVAFITDAQSTNPIEFHKLLLDPCADYAPEQTNPYDNVCYLADKLLDKRTGFC